MRKRFTPEVVITGAWLYLVMLVIIVAGCSLIPMSVVREKAIGLSESHKKNMETARKITANLNEEWAMVSGMIDGWYLDDAAGELSPKANKAKTKLDKVIMEKDWTLPDPIPLKETDKYRYGYTLALHARFGLAALEDLITEVLDNLPPAQMRQVWMAFL